MQRSCQLLMRRVGDGRRRRCGLSPVSPSAKQGVGYPADRPPVEEIVAVMRQAGRSAQGLRLRGLIAVLWRSGMRMSEALALNEADLNPQRGSLLVRSGKGGPRREVGIDPWGREQRSPRLERRVELPVGALFCIISGPTHGHPCSSGAVRVQLRRHAREAGVRRRFAPHQPRHAHAVEMAREGIPLNIIQRQLGHANLGVTSIYLQGIDNGEIIDAVHARHAPVLSASSALRL